MATDATDEKAFDVVWDDLTAALSDIEDSKHE